MEIVSGNAYFVVYRQRNSQGASTALVTAKAGAAAGPAAAGTSRLSPAEAAAATTADILHHTEDDVQSAARLAANSVDTAQVQLHPQLLHTLQQMPRSVHQQVLQLHQEFERACRRHTQVKQDAISRVEQRQQVRLLSQGPYQALGAGVCHAGSRCIVSKGRVVEMVHLAPGSCLTGIHMLFHHHHHHCLSCHGL